MLSWLIDAAPEDEKAVVPLTRRVLTLNFAAIHTSSIVSSNCYKVSLKMLTLTLLQTFTHALFHLAANPQYMQPLREEAENIIHAEGWTRLSLKKMEKLDSFIKETLRLDGIGLRK